MTSKDIHIDLVKVEDMAKILSYGVLSTPGIVMDGQVIHSGSVPSKKMVEQWLA
jgi:predicted thioredoxin/glutaredoxin